MKIGKIVIASIAVTIFNFIVGGLTCGWLFAWVYKVEPVVAWKQMSGPPGIGYMIGSFILSVVLVSVYAILKNGIPGNNKLAKGFAFGLLVWAVGPLSGAYASYAFMNVSTTWVVYLIVHQLVFLPIKGMIIAKIYGE